MRKALFLIQVFAAGLVGAAGGAAAQDREPTAADGQDLFAGGVTYRAMLTAAPAMAMSLLGQFLSPLSNFRTDEFGGSLENRARYPLMACRRIKEKCGEDFLVEVEVSGEEKGGKQAHASPPGVPQQ